MGRQTRVSHVQTHATLQVFDLPWRLGSLCYHHWDMNQPLHALRLLVLSPCTVCANSAGDLANLHLTAKLLTVAVLKIHKKTCVDFLCALRKVEVKREAYRQDSVVHTDESCVITLIKQLLVRMTTSR